MKWASTLGSSEGMVRVRSLEDQTMSGITSAWRGFVDQP